MGSLTYLCDDTRTAWNARPPTSTRTTVDISRRTEFFNHYIGPGSPNFAGRPHSECLTQVRAWQLQHQNQGWKDIGYNALVCGHARLVEGRGLEYSGSHCPDHNTTGFGVQFMVAGTEKPTPAMYARMRKLYDDLVKLKGGALAKRGHRDGVSTSCPGDIVYAWVKAGMPAATGGTTTPTSLRRGDTGPAVEELQRLLNATGATLDVDGSFGPATEAAVKTFQSSIPILVDGIAGPQTIAALKEEDMFTDTDRARLKALLDDADGQTLRNDISALAAKVDALAAKSSTTILLDQGQLETAIRNVLGSLNDPTA